MGRVDRQGVKVCILDSGIEADHPDVGELAGAVAVEVGEGDEISVVDDVEGDLCGHGTACAGIVRSIAKECELYSVRVLGADSRAADGAPRRPSLGVEHGFDVINMSLSTTKSHAGLLHEVADLAYFRRTVLVASAHNMPVESSWRFSSVISVGSHESPRPRPSTTTPARRWSSSRAAST